MKRYERWQVLFFAWGSVQLDAFLSFRCSPVTREIYMKLSHGDVYYAKTLVEGMKFVKLGSSDLVVSEACLGTMTFGGQVSFEDSVEIMNVAFDEFGVNFIDTAEMYPIRPSKETQGRTDVAISKWLKNRNRQDVVLASKVLGRSDGFAYIRGGITPRVRKSDIIESVDKSLMRLGTDYIDLLQIHWPDRYVPLFGSEYDPAAERDDDISFQEQLLGFEEVIKTGKVRYIGVSNETCNGVLRFIELADNMGLPRICSIQNSYSLLVRGQTEISGLIEVCSKRNCDVGFLAYSPLAAGALTGKYINPNPKIDRSKWRMSIFPTYMSRYTNRQSVSATKDYNDIAMEYGLTMTQLSLAWCYTRPFITSTIIGVTSVEQLRENLNSKNCPITEDIHNKIDEVYYQYVEPTLGGA